MPARFGMLHWPAMDFVSIDAGVEYHGQARFLDGKLAKVAYLPHLDADPDCTGIKIGVVEKPVVYPHQTRNARTVAALAFSAGVLVGQFHARYEVEPRAWKGTMDGTVFLRRVVRLAQQRGDWPLIETCLKGVDKKCHEHPLDAYALGLWCLGVEI